MVGFDSSRGLKVTVQSIVMFAIVKRLLSYDWLRKLGQLALVNHKN